MLPKKCVSHFRVRHLGPDGLGMNFALEQPHRQERHWFPNPNPNIMQRLFPILLAASLLSVSQAQHNAGHHGRILMVASNPATSKTTGWPIGVWYSELTHPYRAFTEAGYRVDIASLEGGEIRVAAFDYIFLGFEKDPARMALIRNTLNLSQVRPEAYKAVFLCGG